VVVVFFDVELMVKEVESFARERRREREKEIVQKNGGWGTKSSNADREIKSSDFLSVKIKKKRKISFDPVLTVSRKVPCQQSGMRNLGGTV